MHYWLTIKTNDRIKFQTRNVYWWISHYSPIIFRLTFPSSTNRSTLWNLECCHWIQTWRQAWAPSVVFKRNPQNRGNILKSLSCLKISSNLNLCTKKNPTILMLWKMLVNALIILWWNYNWGYNYDQLMKKRITFYNHQWLSQFSSLRYLNSSADPEGSGCSIQTDPNPTLSLENLKFIKITW